MASKVSIEDCVKYYNYKDNPSTEILNNLWYAYSKLKRELFWKNKKPLLFTKKIIELEVYFLLEIQQLLDKGLECSNKMKDKYCK